MSQGVLYLSYSGMLEPLGQSQVLAYQERLAAEHPVHILSFERAADLKRVDERVAVARRMEAAGIHWHPMRYHKRLSLLATFWDIFRGAMVGCWLVWRHGLRVVHARSYVASVMALVIKRMTGARYVFDMRGFWADERVDGGIWPVGGARYRGAKWFERGFLLAADHVISLTHAAVREMQRFDYLKGRMPHFTVIPTCANLARFHPAALKPEGLVLGYVGSVGTWYMFDEVVSCVARLLRMRPDARLLVVSRSDHAHIRARLAAGGVPDSAVEVQSANHDEMPVQIRRMHAGVFFIKSAFSKQASAPTKLGELLGCGLPCLSYAGVGDMGEVLAENRVGVALEDFDPASVDAGLKQMIELIQDPAITARCVAAAQANFSLEEGVRRYQAVYDSLVDTR